VERDQWSVRVLANPHLDCDAVMAPFAREVLARAAALGRVEVSLDQSRLSDRHQVLMVALRFGERAMPLARRVEETAETSGLARQHARLDRLAAWLPSAVAAGAGVLVLADRFYRTNIGVSHLVLVMALAIDCAVSTGLWDRTNHPLPAEVRPVRKQPRKVARSRTSWFPRGLRCIAGLLQVALPMPALWAASG
jgi:hypothetical protein